MKATLKILAVPLIMLAVGTVSAQGISVIENTEPKYERKVRPIRIGGKIGIPNLIGGNLEYVTPLLNKKLGVSFDYSLLKSDWLGLQNESEDEEYGNELVDDSKMDFNYIEGGLNYYFLNPDEGYMVVFPMEY